jgi:outer membrane protein insertion porin family
MERRIAAGARRWMERWPLLVFLACFSAFLGAQETVEKIEVLGNEKVTRETILYYLTVKEGDFFDEAILRRDFRVLWSTGFFSNIRIEAEPGISGKIVKVIIEENPVIKEIVYKTGKKLKEEDIVNKLKEKDDYLLPYSYYSPAKVQSVKQTIEELLIEKGLTGGEIRADLNKKANNELGIVFRIKEGTKTKVGEIAFAGGPPLADRELSGAMKETKPHGFLSWLTGKDTFTKDKLNGDLENLKKKLQAKGYMEASVGDPVVDETTKTTVFLKKMKMKRITIPIQAGERYSVGEVNVEGSVLVSPSSLRSLIKLQTGHFYSIKNREDAVEKLGELYRNFGHLYVQIMPVESLDPKGKRVNVTFHVDEGKVAYLRQLDFKGNTYTKDKVLRRELLVREGDRFSLELFKNSILRLRQLGLVDLEGEPKMTPDPEEPTEIDVTLNVKELQRNNIQFSAGYSGYEGSFISLSYSTVSLLGAGESLEVMAQYGKRVKNYVFSFTEPYIFDLPLSAGFRVSNRYIYYPGLYTQESRGINYDLGFRVRGFWRANVTYGFEYLDMGAASLDGENEVPLYYTNYYGTAYGYGHYYVGSLSAHIYRNTVDSPLTPSRGTMYLVGGKVSGGILGGEIDLLKPQFEFTHYQPVFKNHVIGLHLSYEFIRSLKGSEVPFWERFYLGGERSLRGYDIYTIGPRNSDGLLVGGEKALILNFEYIIPVGGPLYAILFSDIGNAYARDESVKLTNLCLSSGLEMKIFVPALRVPLRLILAYNTPKIRSNDSNFAFRFAVGTTF